MIDSVKAEWAEREALARRALACIRRWPSGMGVLRWNQGRWEQGVVTRNEGVYGYGAILPEQGWLPDLEDPATIGCLLQLVREAHKAHITGMFDVDVSGGAEMWVGTGRIDDALFTGRTLAEAIVKAIESAPVPVTP
jgi:hypothetical protein